MDIAVLFNGFLSYLLLMVITVGVAFLCGFIAVKIRKRSDAKKNSEDEAKRVKK